MRHQISLTIQNIVRAIHILMLSMQQMANTPAAQILQKLYKKVNIIPQKKIQNTMMTTAEIPNAEKALNRPSVLELRN